MTNTLEEDINILAEEGTPNQSDELIEEQRRDKECA